jgi:hypothetical protein
MGGGRGGAGGFDPSQMTDQQIQMMMQRYDLDKDGRISKAEADQNNRIAPYFDAYASGGYMDVTAYKRFMVDRINNTGPAAQIQMAQRQQGRGGPGGFPGAGNPMAGNPDMTALIPNGGTNTNPKGNREEEQPQVIAYRYGKLPIELPDWWEKLDTDKDGQIGLYEWRADSREINEFIEMDLNGDGLLTPDEWMKYQKQLFEHKPGEKSEAVAARIGSGTNGRTRGGPNSGSYGGPGDRSKFGGTPGPNPFTTGAPNTSGRPGRGTTPNSAQDGSSGPSRSGRSGRGGGSDGSADGGGRGNRSGGNGGFGGGRGRGGNQPGGGGRGRGRGGRGGGGGGGFGGGGDGGFGGGDDE